MTVDPDAFAKALGAQMRAEIAAAGLSARAVAHRAGMQPVVLGRYLNGERDMPVSVLARVLNAIEALAGVRALPNVVLRRAEERLATASRSDDAETGAPVTRLRPGSIEAGLPQLLAADDPKNDEGAE